MKDMKNCKIQMKTHLKELQAMKIKATIPKIMKMQYIRRRFKILYNLLPVEDIKYVKEKKSEQTLESSITNLPFGFPF